MKIEQPVTTNIGRQAGGSVAYLRVHNLEFTTDNNLIERAHPLLQIENSGFRLHAVCHQPRRSAAASCLEFRQV